MTDPVIQSRRDRTVGGVLAVRSGGLSRGFGCSVRSAARFLLDLSVSRNRSRRNHAAETCSSNSKSCDREDGKLHGLGYVVVLLIIRSARVTILCLLLWTVSLIYLHYYRAIQRIYYYRLSYRLYYRNSFGSWCAGEK